MDRAGLVTSLPSYRGLIENLDELASVLELLILYQQLTASPFPGGDINGELVGYVLVDVLQTLERSYFPCYPYYGMELAGEISGCNSKDILASFTYHLGLSNFIQFCGLSLDMDFDDWPPLLRLAVACCQMSRQFQTDPDLLLPLPYEAEMIQRWMEHVLEDSAQTPPPPPSPPMPQAQAVASAQADAPGASAMTNEEARKKFQAKVGEAIVNGQVDHITASELAHNANQEGWLGALATLENAMAA